MCGVNDGRLQNSTIAVAVVAKSGLNIVRKLYTWVEYHAKNGYSVDFQWKNSNGKLSGRFVSRGRFSHLASIIGEAEDVEPREIEIVGVLSGCSILSDRFAIVTPEDTVYSGKLNREFYRREYKIAAEYKAKIRETITVKYASEKVDISYSLLSLIEVRSD